ncbi:MAG: DNA-processing protein DprA [Ignavibacterium album]|uniref:DNA-processing protein DprA n=1 Tax=Ignavibacterium album TaxID=591197 RepID=UPI0026F1BE7C|nr:DNA-processing protein DprA [Ignavibacterium album]MCX8105108.1 DNA-processing protein DprA [Ignavibacterium album]
MTRLSFDQLVDLFLLLSVERIGPAKIRSLLSKFRNLHNILNASVIDLQEVEGISKELSSRIRKISSKKEEVKEFVEKELSTLNKINGRIITVWDEDYPQLLKKIYDPPLLLYVKGKFDDRDDYSIAVVGTRGPTNYGKIQTERIVADLAIQGITIVSGMARGIDSIAHKTALKNNSRTIAVIGSGLDVVYPPENKKLFEEISENGVIITEFPLGTKPDAVNFPKRNRIISGIALGTLVIETGINGGAMQTARLALDQNREVFAVPGNLGVRQSEGTNLLIQRGEAELIISAEDILTELELKLKPVIGKNIPKPEKDLNMFEEKIYNSLTDEPLHIDKISEITNLSTSDCLVHLLSLEFKGLVKQLPGKVFGLL